MAGNYEHSERVAITSGKDALDSFPELRNRISNVSSGFFFETTENDFIHPDHFKVDCVDGVGTKLFLGAWGRELGLENAIGMQTQDAIAMNANDMATGIHVMPSEVVLYIAAQQGIENQCMGEIIKGFGKAITEITPENSSFTPNLTKLETATLDEMISLGVPGMGWDVGVVINGWIRKDKIPNLNPKPGHIIVGVSSTGMHSNGYTSARHVLLKTDVEPRDEWKGKYEGRYSLSSRPEILGGQRILDAMIEPTALYMREAALIGERFSEERDIYGVNITGNGLMNFNRVGGDVVFNITDPLEPLPIHRLLCLESSWSSEEAYRKQNMGMGFAYVVPNIVVADQVVGLINDRAENSARIIGEVLSGKKGDGPVTILNKPYFGDEEVVVYRGY